MDENEDRELKKEFQLERVIFFSDAVFAIIITIMILDVKLPEVEKYASEQEARAAFIHTLPKLVGYGVSFYAVGDLWIKHLRIFSFLKDYNLRLVSLNLLFLFSVSLFPFGLSFFFNSEQIMQYTWGVYTYMLIYFLTILTQAMLTGYLVRNKEELCSDTDKIETVLRWRTVRLDYFMVPIVVLLMAVTVYFNLDRQTSLYVIVGPIAIFNISKRYLNVKHYPDYKHNKYTLLHLFAHKIRGQQRIKKVK